jgi:hypothetical protein
VLVAVAVVIGVVALTTGVVATRNRSSTAKQVATDPLPEGPMGELVRPALIGARAQPLEVPGMAGVERIAAYGGTVWGIDWELDRLLRWRPGDAAARTIDHLRSGLKEIGAAKGMVWVAGEDGKGWYIQELNADGRVIASLDMPRARLSTSDAPSQLGVTPNAVVFRDPGGVVVVVDPVTHHVSPRLEVSVNDYVQTNGDALLLFDITTGRLRRFDPSGVEKPIVDFGVPCYIAGVARGAIWVHLDHSRLSRLSPLDGEELAWLNVSAVAKPAVGPSGVWVFPDGGRSRSDLWWVDATTGRVISLGSQVANVLHMAVDETGMWWITGDGHRVLGVRAPS